MKSIAVFLFALFPASAFADDLMPSQAYDIAIETAISIDKPLDEVFAVVSKRAGFDWITPELLLAYEGENARLAKAMVKILEGSEAANTEFNQMYQEWYGDDEFVVNQAEQFHPVHISKMDTGKINCMRMSSLGIDFVRKFEKEVAEPGVPSLPSLTSRDAISFTTVVPENSASMVQVCEIVLLLKPDIPAEDLLADIEKRWAMDWPSELIRPKRQDDGSLDGVSFSTSNWGDKMEKRPVLDKNGMKVVSLEGHGLFIAGRHYLKMVFVSYIPILGT